MKSSRAWIFVLAFTVGGIAEADLQQAEARYEASLKKLQSKERILQSAETQVERAREEAREAHAQFASAKAHRNREIQAIEKQAYWQGKEDAENGRVAQARVAHEDSELQEIFERTYRYSYEKFGIQGRIPVVDPKNKPMKVVLEGNRIGSGSARKRKPGSS